MAARPYCKIISGLGGKDLQRVERLAELYGRAGADWFDVDLDPAVVAAALRGLQTAQALDTTKIMVSCGLEGDPHVGAALLDTAVCATCAGCVIPELLACVQRPLAERAHECPSCAKCFAACPLGAIRVAQPVRLALAALPECLALGVQGVELHLAGASVAAAQEAVVQLHAQLAEELWLSLSLGAQVQPLAQVLLLAETAARLGRSRWLLQVEGRPMHGQGADGEALQLVAQVLAKYPEFPVQLAGGTGMESAQRCRDRGLQVAGIAYGTTARTLVAKGLQVQATQDELAQAQLAANALVATVRA
jgi:ferredoxin